MRPSKRKNDELREVSVELGVLKHAEGSCLIKFGDTEVLCSASVENNVPHFLKGQGLGWITAEYSMLPRATGVRVKRESSQGKPSGRTQEIQRLIGRSLRAAVDTSLLGERQIILDCDVINADGGTRTCSITGAYIALSLACRNLLSRGVIKKNPIAAKVAAISCGIYMGKPLLDLDYAEDSEASVDANFVFSDGGLIEIQSTAEKKSFSRQEFSLMLDLAEYGVSKLFEIQKEVLLEFANYTKSYN